MPKKVIIDILMFVCMILEFSRWYMQPIYHEIIWIALLILVILHLWFNRQYFQNIFKWKYNLARTVMVIVNVWFFITFFLTIVFWILSSQNLLTFANIHSMTLISLHKVFGYISLLLMWIHLWINIVWLTNKLSQKIWNKLAFYGIEVLLIAYWIYAWIKLNIWKHIIWEYWFWNVDGNIWINILNYLAVILMITLIVNEIYKLILKRK